MSDECDHVIGVHKGLSSSGYSLSAGGLVRMSHIPKVVMGARGFMSTRLEMDHNLVDSGLRGKALTEATRAVTDGLHEWDQRPLLEKLAENCEFFNYCPECGTYLAGVLKHDGKQTCDTDHVTVRKRRTK